MTVKLVSKNAHVARNGYDEIEIALSLDGVWSASLPKNKAH
jgi:hypothetical protein